MKDSLKQFLEVRDALMKEREKLTSRLREINSVFGSAIEYAPRWRMRNSISLKAAILEVTKKKPLTKQEILDAVLALGYKFSTYDPLNSIGVILYGKNPRFTNNAGRFHSH
jgi:hypothetical protein